MVACTENPNECGGKGGCEGATAELAFEYAQKGIALARDWVGGYLSGNKKAACPQVLPNPVVRVNGFVRLPVNTLPDVLMALQNGPVVFSVDANGWNYYKKGIYDSCEQDAIVTHAALGMGYGEDGGTKYWLLRNSWGPKWGEGGFLRMFRHDGDMNSKGNEGYCGMDNKPQEGVGCKGGPAEVKVCGMCGVLSDVCHPSSVVVLPDAEA